MDMNTEMDEKVLKLVCKRIETISNKEVLDNASVNELDTLIDIKKDILECMAMIQSLSGDGYSGRNSYGHDRGYYIQPYHYAQNGYSRAERDMSSYLRSMAPEMPQHKRDMVYDFANRIESM